MNKNNLIDNEDIVAIEKSTRREKLINIYKRNKKKLLCLVIIFFLSIGSFFVYTELQEQKSIKLSNLYFESLALIENGKNEKAKLILKDIIYQNNPTYSTLSLLTIIDKNLIEKNKEKVILFDHLIKNNNFDDETKNLLIYKKAIIMSSYVDENTIIKALTPLINKNSLWSSHASLLLGDYFFFKNDLIKAKDFYEKVLISDNATDEIKKNALIQLGNL